VLSEQPEARAQRLLASEAGGALSTGDTGVEDHLLANRNPGHPFAYRLDDPGAVGASDVRQINPRQTLEHEDVELVEGGSAQCDAHPTHLWLGQRPLSGDQPLRTSVLLEVQGLHDHLR
jgi:hypothetical protein